MKIYSLILVFVLGLQACGESSTKSKKDEKLASETTEELSSIPEDLIKSFRTKMDIVHTDIVRLQKEVQMTSFDDITYYSPRSEQYFRSSIREHFYLLSSIDTYFKFIDYQFDQLSVEDFGDGVKFTIVKNLIFLLSELQDNLEEIGRIQIVSGMPSFDDNLRTDLESDCMKTLDFCFNI